MEFVKRCKVWKLKDDVTAGIFREREREREIERERVQTRAALVVEKPAGVEEVWRNFKECMIEEAVEVCGKLGDEKAQGVLVVERRDCGFGKRETTFIQVAEGA